MGVRLGNRSFPQEYGADWRMAGGEKKKALSWQLEERVGAADTSNQTLPHVLPLTYLCTDPYPQHLPITANLKQLAQNHTDSFPQLVQTLFSTKFTCVLHLAAQPHGSEVSPLSGIPRVEGPMF